MTWNCKIFGVFHTWTDWKETSRHTLQSVISRRATVSDEWKIADPVSIGLVVVQERMCVHCGKRALRTEVTGI